MLIYRRNAMFGGAKWRNPYVTDGLVAMWDGEWNAGPGVHDANATTWKDLVGDIDFALLSGGSFNTNSLVVNGYSAVANYSENTVPATIEIVLQRTNSTSRSCVFMFGKKHPISSQCCRMMMVIDNQTVQYAGGANLASKNMDGLLHTRSIIFDGTSLSSIPTGLYKNGEVDQSAYTYNNSWSSIGTDYLDKITIGHGYSNPTTGRPMVGEIYSLRAYSRALTDAEIAANFAIDKARFNLPDAAS